MRLQLSPQSRASRAPPAPWALKSSANAPLGNQQRLSRLGGPLLFGGNTASVVGGSPPSVSTSTMRTANGVSDAANSVFTLISVGGRFEPGQLESPASLRWAR